MSIKICFVDFETYSEHPIKSGSFRYAQDKSTEVICMSYSFDQENIKLWHPGLPDPLDFIDHIKNSGIIRSYNVTFEYAIINYCCHRLYGWPKLKIKNTLCTMTDGLALALPGNLKDIAEVLGVEQQKDNKGKLLINKLSKPHKPTKKLPYTRLTKDIAPELFEQMYEYNIQDVKTEIAVYKALPRYIHTNKKELAAFHQTLAINEKGLPIDMDLVNAVMVHKDNYEKQLNSEIINITNGELQSTNSRPQSLKWLKEKGLDLEGYTKADIKKALTIPNLDEGVKRFLEIRSEMSRTPIKKFNFLNSAICEDSTIKNSLIFHKASTGRFSAAGFQMQNLPRDTAENPEELIDKFKNNKNIKTDNIFNEAVSLIRNTIRAPKGYKLVVSDFSSIENRVVAWLSGDKSTLIDFENDIDQYKVAASSIFNVRYDNVTKGQRNLGKVSVLSCCYGAGAKSFHKVCNEGWGIPIDMTTAEDIVEGYRETYPKIVNLWYGLRDAAIEAVSSGRVTQYKKIKFRVMGEFLYMRLPNGRLLSYYKPLIQQVMAPWGKYTTAITHMGVNGYTRKWERLKLIPGRLCENATQASARDILIEAMLRVEENGFNVIGCVHDEIITCVKENSSLDIKKLNKLMCVKPDWCLDLPIEAEGFESKFYKK